MNDIFENGIYLLLILEKCVSRVSESEYCVSGVKQALKQLTWDPW